MEKENVLWYYNIVIKTYKYIDCFRENIYENKKT